LSDFLKIFFLVHQPTYLKIHIEKCQQRADDADFLSALTNNKGHKKSLPLCYMLCCHSSESLCAVLHSALKKWWKNVMFLKRCKI